jgi:hypothetical protein
MYAILVLSERDERRTYQWSCRPRYKDNGNFVDRNKERDRVKDARRRVQNSRFREDAADSVQMTCVTVVSATTSRHAPNSKDYSS